jgi:hypothetical protein
MRAAVSRIELQMPEVSQRTPLTGGPRDRRTVKAGWEIGPLCPAATGTMAPTARPPPRSAGVSLEWISAAPASPARPPGRKMTEMNAHICLRDARRDLCGTNADFLPPQDPHVGPGTTTPDNASMWAAARWREPASSPRGDELRGRRLAPGIGQRRYTGLRLRAPRAAAPRAAAPGWGQGSGKRTIA